MHFCSLNDYHDILENQEKLINSRNKDLVELRKLRLPLPNTLILFHSSAQYYYQYHKYPEEFEKEFDFYIERLEKKCEKKLGDPGKPLLLNITTDFGGRVTGVGFSEQTLPFMVERYGKIRTYTYYIQFLHELCAVALQAPFVDFYSFIGCKNHRQKDEFIADISESDFLSHVKKFKEKVSSVINQEFPRDLSKVLRLILDRIMINVCENIEEDIFIKEMILPICSVNSLEGVFYTRNPYTGSKNIYGVYNGSDNVKYHISNSYNQSTENLETKFPVIFKQLNSYRTVLEKYYKDIMEVNFITEENGKHYLTQITKAPKTARASLQACIDLHKAGIINTREAIENISPDDIETLCHVALDPESKKSLHAFEQTGVPGAPGATTGKLFLNTKDIREYFESSNKENSNKSIVLAVDDLTIDDHWVINFISGLITQSSGMSSHGAVMARSKGIPCIVGFNEAEIDPKLKKLTVGVNVLNQGDDITMEVTDKGYLYKGKGKLVQVSGEENILMEFQKLLFDFQKKENVNFQIMVNINNAEDATKGLSFGADGVGLCRTENFFISKDRLQLIRELLFSFEMDRMRVIYEKIHSLQVKDYYKIFEVMHDKTVVIRLMDFPLHEVMPNSQEEIDEIRKEMPFISEDYIRKTVSAYHENNPMFGLRGCRYGLINKELYPIQISAILTAAYQYKQSGGNPHVFILVPLVMKDTEFLELKHKIMEIENSICSNSEISDDEKIILKVGAMIELPSAALSTDKMASYADFFSFGTNDLTQATYGLSRNDVGSFLPFYLNNNLIRCDPFSNLDDEVCELIKIAVKKGREVRPDMTFSICGEQGGASESLGFALNTKINSVSVSPYRILTTRLRLLHQYIKNKPKIIERSVNEKEDVDSVLIAESISSN